MHINDYERYELITICYIIAYIVSVISVFAFIGDANNTNMIEYIGLHIPQTAIIIVTSMIGSSLIARFFIKNI